MSEKVNLMCAIEGDLGLKYRNAAIVYLYKVKNYAYNQIAELSGLAAGTIRIYVNKFCDLLDWAKEIFTTVKKRVVKEASAFWCYIDKIEMPDGSMWCKIGQTTQTPKKRASGFSWSVNGYKVRPKAVEIKAAFKCKNATAMQNMEDCLRIGMTAIDPEGYIKNDRLDSWEESYIQKIMESPFVKMGITQFTI